jgi:hypothetical protein
MNNDITVSKAAALTRQRENLLGFRQIKEASHFQNKNPLNIKGGLQRKRPLSQSHRATPSNTAYPLRIRT